METNEEYLICYYDTRAYEPYNLPGILYLKNNNKFCFYDAQKDEFFDSNLKPIDLTGKYVIPYCFLVKQEDFFKKIYERGGIIPCGIDNTYPVTHWPLTYKTKRNTLLLKGKDLLNFEYVEKLKEVFGEEVFFKTLDKGYSGSLKLDYLQDHKTLIYNVLTMHKEEEFIVSDLVDILSDDIGKREYRIFVFNNKVLNISRYTEFVLHSIDKEVYEKATEIVNSLKESDFPSSYVLDLFEYNEDNKVQIDVLEFNPIYGSGLYLYNSVGILPAPDILHQNVNNVAFGKERLVSLCKEPDPIYADSLVASNYYEKGSFAYDLKAIEEYYPHLNTNDFKLGRHININIEDYKKAQLQQKPQKEKKDMNPLEQIRFRFAEIHEEFETQKKEDFLRNLSLEHCPLDVMYLCKEITPGEIEEYFGRVPEVTEIKLNPEFLKKIKSME